MKEQRNLKCTIKKNQTSNRRLNPNNNRGRRIIRENWKSVPKDKNLLHFLGNIFKCRICNICESINHWEDDCPEKTNGKPKAFGEITHFQSVLHTKDPLRQLKTVCEKTWFNCYQHALSKEEWCNLREEASSTVFKFTNDPKVSSSEKVTIPAKIGDHSINIVTEIVEDGVPLLLSKESKKDDTNSDFANDLVSMFETQKLVTISLGHYAVPLIESQNGPVTSSWCKVTWIVKTVDISDKLKVTKKLHSQFSHSPREKLL